MRALLLLGFLLPAPVFAQAIENGSFENTGFSGCGLVSNKNASTALPGCYGFGSTTGIDLLNNTCGPGMAQDGNNFIAMTTDEPDFAPDMLTLELTSPLQAETTYTLTIYHKRKVNATSPPVNIGYSMDSNSLGEFINYVHALDFQGNWTSTQLTFIPNFNAKYITLAATNNGEIIYLDNLSITDGTSGIKNSFKSDSKFLVDHANLTAVFHPGNTLSSPYRIIVIDLSGRTVYTTENAADKGTKIDLKAFHSGMYCIYITGTGGQFYSDKFLVP